tara:strand:+ start:33443 stop:36841 length:3399 start_codon:yes stop_codon:yes gene_type:complete
MQNIKYFIFSSISLLLFLFSINVSALEEAVPEDIEHVEVSCGIGEDTDAESNDFLYVIPNNFGICEEDISFKMLYMLFGESLDSEVSQSIIKIVHEPYDSDIMVSKMSDVGKSIQAIYSALTILLFTLITILISYNTVNFIYKTQTSGEFMGQKRSKSLNVGIQSLIIIILVTPVGSMLLAQVLLLALAIVGIKLANFFLSTFLNTIDVKTAEINYSSGLNFSTSSANTESMINANLCEIRSNQQIWQNNLRNSTDYTEDYFLDRDGGEFREVVNACNAYTYNIKYNNDIFVGFTSSKIEPNMCAYHNPVSDILYEEDEFGYSYDCFDVNYSFPSTKLDIFTDDMKNEELIEKVDTIVKYYENADEYNEYKSQFNSENIINYIVPSLKTDIESLMSDPDYKKEDLVKIYDKHATNFYENYIKNNPLLTLDRNIVENVNNFNNKDIANFVYLSNLIALNYIYGAYINKEIGEFSQASYLDYGLPDDPLKLVNDPLLGYDELNNQLTKKATTLALNYHCVSKIQEDMNVSNGVSLVYKTKEALNLFNSNLDIQGELKDYFSYECLNTFREYTSDEDPESTEFFDYYNGLDKFDLGEYNFDKSNLFEKASLTKEDPILTEANIPLIENHLKKVANGYNLYKNISIGFFYITKSAIAKNVAKELKITSDNKVLVDTRKKGWAGLGSMLLAISQEQTNSMGMINDITNSFSVSNYISMNANPAMANENAFIDEDEPTILKPENRLSNLEIKGLFENSIQTIGSLSTISDEEDSEALLQYFVNAIIEFMFEDPLQYLKDATGLDADQDIVNGLENCSKGSSNCVPNSTHPINGLMQFGQELMYNVILILILTYVVNLIADLISFDDKKKDKDKKGGVKQMLKGLKVFGGIFTVIIIIIEIIVVALAMLLNAIKPIMFMLLLISVIVGYLMPLIPYLMTAMIVFSWFISFFTVSIALPVSLLIMGRLKSDGTTNFNIKTIWEMVGNILLKPSLATIAIIFAWSLVSVSIYYVNSTVFYIISNTTGDFLFSLITTLFTYVLYLFILYYVVQQSLQIIIKFSDDVANTIGITSSKDKSDYDSMGLEKFILAQQLRDTTQKIDSTITNKTKKMIKDKKGEDSINLKKKLFGKVKKIKDNNQE